MVSFRFRTRDPSRDRNTDTQRQARLTQFLGQLRSEIDGEARGLRDRYESAQTSAAFAYEAAEDGADSRLALKADLSAQAMSCYGDRLANLRRQSELLGKLESDATQLAAGTTADA